MQNWTVKEAAAKCFVLALLLAFWVMLAWQGTRADTVAERESGLVVEK